MRPDFDYRLTGSHVATLARDPQIASTISANHLPTWL
jgi:hypothetical protein